MIVHFISADKRGYRISPASMSALLQSFGKQLAQCSGRFLPIHMDSDDADEVGDGGEGSGGGGDGGEDVKKKYPRGNYAYQRERQDDGRFISGPTSGASAHTTNKLGQTVSRSHAQAQRAVCFLCFGKYSSLQNLTKGHIETIVKATILPEYGQERYSWLPTVVCPKCRIHRLAKWKKELADGVNAE